jgi:hypothetical protein
MMPISRAGVCALVLAARFLDPASATIAALGVMTVKIERIEIEGTRTMENGVAIAIE